MTVEKVLEKSYITRLESYDEAAVREAFSVLISDSDCLSWVKPGMTVGLKMNLCAARAPEAAATTHPALASEITRRLVELGAKVVIGDSPGGPYNQIYLGRVYEASKMTDCEKAGAVLNDNFGSSEISFPEGVSIRAYSCCDWVKECDALINFSKLKSHGLMGMTAAVKNLYGVIPGTMKSEYHYLHSDPMDFANMLVDLNESLKPELCIVDAVDIMEGNGPTAGVPRHMGLLMLGTCPYELDRIGAALLGVSEKEIPYLEAAKSRGLLPKENLVSEEFIRANKIDNFVRSGATSSWFIVTDEDKGMQKFLKKAMYVLFRSKPAADKGCTGCGHCIKDCPADAIKIKNGKAVIDRGKCVRCFCCQEFCPTGAMKVKRSAIARIVVK